MGLLVQIVDTQTLICSDCSRPAEAEAGVCPAPVADVRTWTCCSYSNLAVGVAFQVADAPALIRYGRCRRPTEAEVVVAQLDART